MAGVNSTKVIYICSEARSGSTLLVQMLGAHPELTAVGEIQQLNAYSTYDRAQYDPVHELVCACGLVIAQCPFWRSVRDKVGSLENVQLHIKSLHPWLRRIYPLMKSYGEENFRIFEAIPGIVVDSSKSPQRLLGLHVARPDALLSIFLVRDYRAVTHSKMKRGSTLEQSAKGWVKRLKQMQKASRIVRHPLWIRYEDLCSNTEPVMRKICAASGIDFAPAMLERAAETHILGGSPSRSGSRKVTLDRSYESAITQGQRALMRKAAGRTLGYL